MVVFLLSVFFIIIAAASIIFFYSLKTGVVPMPSFSTERDAVINILKDYEKIATITDLGAGWGGLARKAAKMLPERNITAVEQSIIPHLFSKLPELLTNRNTVRYIRADFNCCSLKDNEAFITYLSGPVMKQLRRKFEQQQPQGGILISIAFSMPGWTPVKTEYAGGLLPTPIYVYEL